MESYYLEAILNILYIAIISGFLIACIPMLIGIGIHGILNILKKAL